jgi:hypothetical protein
MPDVIYEAAAIPEKWLDLSGHALGAEPLI